MEMYETALGRWVTAHESQMLLQDNIMRLLFDYGTSRQNPNNEPMELSGIAHAVTVDAPVALAALDALRKQQPPLVEEGQALQGERTFRITGAGIRFVLSLRGPSSLP